MSEKQGWGNICERADTCALTGAGAFFAAIDKSEVLINGPLWCYFYALRHLEKARPDMYTRFYGSQPDNNAVIYGSEEYVTQERGACWRMVISLRYCFWKAAAR